MWIRSKYKQLLEFKYFFKGYCANKCSSLLWCNNPVCKTCRFPSSSLSLHHDQIYTALPINKKRNTLSVRNAEQFNFTSQASSFTEFKLFIIANTGLYCKYAPKENLNRGSGTQRDNCWIWVLNNTFGGDREKKSWSYCTSRLLCSHLAISIKKTFKPIPNQRYFTYRQQCTSSVNLILF